MNFVKRWSGHAWRDLVYALGMLGTSVVAFTVWVTALSVTLSLLIFVVGAFVWWGSVYLFRWTAWLDRQLAGWIREEEIPAIYRRPRQPGVIEGLRCVTTDPQTWRDLGWLVLGSFVGFCLATVALAATTIVLAYLTLPIWFSFIPDPGQQYGTLNFGIFLVDTVGEAFIVTAIGLALIPIVLLLNRGAARAHSALARQVLAPSEAQRLRARVEDLASTRAGAVEASQEQLERIERDLHDGAQARLVALAMDLGMAEEELERDPDAAGATVRRAREETLAALAELRDLSRGLRPALLEERGLAAAIEALAGRSALPVTLSVVGAVDDAPEPAQTAAYFVVAEALTNAAKHSGAERVTVRLERREGALAATVEDRGGGGADPNGSGLDGLRKRVAALDGHLEVASPPGGPTIVSAEIPCA